MNAFSGYLSSDVESNSGELLQGRFAVLAACEFGKTSSDAYYTKTGSKVYRRRGGTFTVALLNSLGCAYPGGKRGSGMPGDSNKDKKLTLKEAYKSVKSTVNKMNDMLEDNNYVAYYEGDSNNPAGYYYFYTLDQSVQMGGNGNTVLFIQK